MKWSDPRPIKAYLVLMAVVSTILASLASLKWIP